MTEVKVTGRSALTRSERNKAHAQSRSESGMRPSWEYRGQSYERMRDRAQAARDAARAETSSPFKARPPRGSNPYNMSIPMGTPPATIPTGLNPDGSIPGQLAKPGQWGEKLPWQKQQALKGMLAKLRRSRILGLHPWLRALQAALDAYDLFRFVQTWNQGPPGTTFPGFTIEQTCSGGPGALIPSARGNPPPRFCRAPFYADVRTSTQPVMSWYNVDFNDMHGSFDGWYRHYPKFWLGNPNNLPYQPVPMVVPFAPTIFAPTRPSFPAPGVSPPSIPVPLRNPVAGAHNALGPQPMTTEGIQFVPAIPPIPPKIGTPHKNEPPPNKTKEKKVRVPKVVMRMFEMATDVTEAVDLVEALYEALPERIRKQVTKSGRTDKRARIGEGKAYATALDKAQLLWKHLDLLDVEQAVKNVIINHIEDALVGGLNRGADKARDRMGGIGWGVNM